MAFLFARRKKIPPPATDVNLNASPKKIRTKSTGEFSRPRARPAPPPVEDEGDDDSDEHVNNSDSGDDLENSEEEVTDADPESKAPRKKAGGDDAPNYRNGNFSIDMPMTLLKSILDRVNKEQPTGHHVICEVYNEDDTGVMRLGGFVMRLSTAGFEDFIKFMLPYFDFEESGLCISYKIHHPDRPMLPLLLYDSEGFERMLEKLKYTCSQHVTFTTSRRLRRNRRSRSLGPRQGSAL